MRAPESADLPARWRSSPPDCLRHRTPAVAGPPPSAPGRLPGQPPRCVVLQSGESLPASSRTSRSLTGRRVHLEPGQLTPVDDRLARCPRRELHVEEHQVVQGPRPRLHRPGARSAANRAQSLPPRGRHRGSVNPQSTESKAISPFFQRAIATSICPLRCLIWPCMTHSHNCVELSDRSGEVCNNLTASSA